MPETPTIPDAKADTAASTASPCMHCGYDLRGLPTETCPECGRTFDPALWRHGRRRRWFISLTVMIIVMYTPFSWLLFVDDDPSYRSDWLKIAPVVPGLVPTHLASALTFGKPLSEGRLIVFASIVTLAVLLAFARLGARSRFALIISATVLFALASLDSFITLQLFRM